MGKQSNSQSITFKPISPLLALDVSLQVPISSSYRSVPVLVDEHASVGHGRPLSARVDLPLDQVVHLVLAARGLRGLVVVRVDGGPSVHAVWMQRGSPADVNDVDNVTFIMFPVWIIIRSYLVSTLVAISNILTDSSSKNSDSDSPKMPLIIYPLNLSIIFF